MHSILHRKFADTLGSSSKFGRVAEHRGERNIGVNDEKTGSQLCVCNCASAFYELSHYAGLEFSGYCNFHVHDWLENHSVCFLECLSERVSCCDLEGHSAGVDDVSLAIGQDVLHANYWITGLRSFLRAFVEGLLNTRYVLVRNVVTCRCVLENTR